jgi:hypothetical protein
LSWARPANPSGRDLAGPTLILISPIGHCPPTIGLESIAGDPLHDKGSDAGVIFALVSILESTYR